MEGEDICDEAGALSVVGVVCHFGARTAVDRVSLTVRTGEIVAVVGPSGCGKTTLLRLIAGFEVPTGGTVRIAGRTVAAAGTWVEPERRGVGLVPQGDSLFPHLSVAENVAFGVRRDAARVAEVLEVVGLADRAHSDPGDLSGGERQRVVLARALAPRPTVVLLDEPFSSLDAALRVRLRTEIAAVLRRAGSTALWVTHDQEEALGLADRVMVMREGRAIQVGSPTQLYWEPADAWTAGFLGDINVVPAQLDTDVAVTAIGRFALARVPSAAALDVVGLRPETIILERCRLAPARVTARSFRGRDVLYEVTEPALGTLRVQTPPFEVLEIGDRVRLSPAPDARAITLPGSAPTSALATPNMPATDASA